MITVTVKLESLRQTFRQRAILTLIFMTLLRQAFSPLEVFDDSGSQCMDKTNCSNPSSPPSSLDSSDKNLRTDSDTILDESSSPFIHRYILCKSASCRHAKHLEQQYTGLIRNRNSTEAKEMYQQGRFILHSKISLMESVSLWNTQSVQVKYNFDDAAHLLSHLEAILMAYADGSELAFFFEEDAILEPNFWSQWEQVASVAPSDWKALQWTTNSVPTLQQGVHLHKNMDRWISWFPDYIGTHAYTLKREGMEAILAQTCKIHANRTVWNITLDHPMLLPHEVIFYLASPAYTATFPWSQSLETTRVLEDGKLLPLPSHVFNNFSSRNETVLVLMAILLASNKTFTHELSRLRTDVETLCDFYHANAKCHWLVKVVLTDQSLLPLFNNCTIGFSPHVEFEVSISDQRFNKFSYLVPHIPIMHNYDLVVFKDNDQRIAGTPWNTMLNIKEKAVLVGPLRQVVAQSLRGTQSYVRKSFNVAENWKYPIPKWSYDLYIHVEELQISYLEEHFVIMDGNFAEWFWPSVLFPDFVNQPSDWGVDYVWCAAAMKYANEVIIHSTKSGCLQIPVISLHEDAGQIIKDSAYHSQGRSAIAMLYKNLPYPPWSESTLGKMFHMKQHQDIDNSCKQLLQTSEVDIHKCFQVAMMAPMMDTIW